MNATGQTIHNQLRSHVPTVLVFIALTIELMLIYLLVIFENDGKLFYTLDDPYIHLAVAENLPHGHYGINMVEPSSPSSSIIYPFVLVLGLATGFADLFPLLFSIICLIATSAVLIAVLGRCELKSVPNGGWIIAGLTFAILNCLNIVGLPFSGMEHSAHVLMTVLVILGLMQAIEDGLTTWWFAAALIAGPLLRFEAFAVTGPALLILLWHGRWKFSLTVCAILLMLLSSYFLFMISMGLPILPSSVMVKSSVAANAVEGGSVSSMIRRIISNVRRALETRQATILSVLAYLILVRLVFRKSGGNDVATKAIVMFCLLSVALHFLAGRFGWFSRYEIYIMATATLGAFYVWRLEVSRLLREYRATFAAMVLALVIIGLPYLKNITQIPSASRNVYEQQYQMHRFVTEFYRAPVAVNDLGWVSYRNSEYVLDLWGLGSETARQARASKTEWVGALADRHDVDLAMVYEAWIGRRMPPSWNITARLELGSDAITAACNVVTFYAGPDVDREDLAMKLRRFEESLPDRVSLEVYEPGQAVPPLVIDPAQCEVSASS
jgi:hypothetical protein